MRSNRFYEKTTARECHDQQHKTRRINISAEKKPCDIRAKPRAASRLVYVICIDVDAVIMRGLCNWCRKLPMAAVSLINCGKRRGANKNQAKDNNSG